MLRLELDYEGGVVNFSIDQERSFIEGIIFAHEPDKVFWAIEIHCHGALIPPRPEERDEVGPDYLGFPEDCWLEIADLSCTLNSWRDLAGKAFERNFAPNEGHPILPDNPSNFFFAGCHHVLNNNHVAFGERQGTRFAIKWRCLAQAYAEDKGKPIEVTTVLPLRQFQVYLSGSGALSLEDARRCVLQFARPEDIGEPVQRYPEWVVVPLRREAV